MNKSYMKGFLSVLTVVVVFLVCLYGITSSNVNQSETVTQDNIQVQPSNISIGQDSFYSESEIDGQFQTAKQFLALIDLPDTAWSISYAAALESDFGFSDVKPDDWFYEAVMWAVNEKITNGMEANKFGPRATCNNAQVLTFLWRTYGQPSASTENPFQDVSANNYYSIPALWAYEHNMVSGTVFSPKKDCTRAMAVEYLWKAAGSPAASVSTQFTDISASSPVSQAVSWAVENGITAGTTSTTFSPNETCTRAQVVTFLYRDIQYLNTTDETITLPSGVSYAGKVVNGVPHGKGVLTIPDVGHYDGEFQNGKRSGTGTFTWISVEIYTGTWTNDEIAGNGTFTLVSGDSLVGTFSDSRLLEGTYHFSEDYGTVEIPVSNGKLQTSADAKISILDGPVYSGTIINGKLNGSCEITFANGDSYAGNVTNNLKSGTGIYTYTQSSTGERLSGTFSHNDPVGECTYFSASNTKYLTTWRDRQCIDITRGVNIMDEEKKSSEELFPKIQRSISDYCLTKRAISHEIKFLLLAL